MLKHHGVDDNIHQQDARQRAWKRAGGLVGGWRQKCRGGGRGVLSGGAAMAASREAGPSRATLMPPIPRTVDLRTCVVSTAV